jgi:hypothetical protein
MMMLGKVEWCVSRVKIVLILFESSAKGNVFTGSVNGRGVLREHTSEIHLYYFWSWVDIVSLQKLLCTARISISS